jgi:hypothetical protein
MAEYVSKEQPIPLFTIEGGEPKGYLCGVCKAVRFDRRSALYCCGTAVCDDCGTVTKDRIFTCCDPCRQRRDAKSEADLFAKAKKVDWREYQGWVWLDGAGGCRNGYFDSVESLIEWIGDQLHDDPEFDLPDYAWACDEVKLSIDAGGVIESATEEHHEDAFEECDREGLQKLLDEWCAEQGVVSYQYQHQCAVDLIGAFDEVIKEAHARRAGGGAT